MIRPLIALALVATATPAATQQVAPTPSAPYARAIAAGYKAAMLCSGIFNAGRAPTQIERDELRGIYPDYAEIVPKLDASIDRKSATVTVAFDPMLPPRRAVWHRVTGCTTYPIGMAAPAIVTTYATPPAPAPADPARWPQGDAGIAPRPSATLAATLVRGFDRASYGKESETLGVVVVHDGRIVGERYREGFGPFTPNRTWSIAKSIAGTLVGRAALDPRGAVRIPEWASPLDPRRNITLDDLLRMKSGLHSATAGNRTDATYFGGTAVTEETVAWPIEVKPGTRFRYANNDILLAMRAVRATIGEVRYRAFPQAALFAPLGMMHTTAETDWKGNYILSSQVWTTARDLARLGQFWLDDGVWQGKRLLPAGWMTYMTTPSGPQPADGPGYGATMWLFGPKQGLPPGSYAAQGNRGQYVMVIPSKRLVIVRRGEDPGAARFDIAKFAADVSEAL